MKQEQVIINTIYRLALRRIEVCKIMISDIDMEQQQVHIRGKGNTYIPLPVPDDIWAQWLPLIEKRGMYSHLFERSPGIGYGGRDIYRIVSAAQGTNPHQLRHNRATDLVNKGAYLAHVQRLLRHRHISSTERYWHTACEQIRPLVNS